MMEKIQEMYKRIEALEEQVKAQQEQVKAQQEQVEAQQELLNILAPYTIESRRKLDDKHRDSGYNYATSKQNRIAKAEKMNKTGALSEPIEITDWL